MGGVTGEQTSNFWPNRVSDFKMITDEKPGETHISHVAMRVPVFSTNNVKLFFVQLEANFANSGIIQEKTRFNTLVSALDIEILKYASDLVFNQPKESPYTSLKQRLIQEFEFSEIKKVKTLLQDLELAEKKPSHLLREMRELSGSQLDETFLKNFWLSKLPLNVQAILSTSNEKFPELAIIADKILEFCPINSECSSIRPAHNQKDPSINDLALKVESLSRKVDLLTTLCNDLKGSRNQSRPRGRAGNFRSKSPGSKVPRSALCWYHEKYAEKASKCVPPCNFSKNE